MSYDGYESFVIMALEDEGALDELAERFSRSISGFLERHDEPLPEGALELGYGFGYGETSPVSFEPLDELVRLPWETWDTGSDDEMRWIPASKCERARKRVKRLLQSDPGELAPWITEITETDGQEDSVVERLAAGTKGMDPADAETTGARVAQVLQALHRTLKKAAKAHAGVVVFRREEAA